MFPDFSTAFDGDCAESMEKGDDEDESNKRNDTMADEELSRLLHGLLDRHGVEDQLESRSMKMMFDEMYLPMMWLLDTTCGAMAVESDIDRSMI
ncbi:unnamed protein product, partial [Anisakis simplex]|uniref:Uncharacterized protein n=1 Tax=Anisakis simplex TaxID=6269 RepID=A0A0M3JKB3_ANISI